jgi:hypothetical protein
VSTHIIRDYEGNRPLWEPAVYIHLFTAQHTNRKPVSLIQRLAAFVRRKVTTTCNK